MKRRSGRMPRRLHPHLLLRPLLHLRPFLSPSAGGSQAFLHRLRSRFVLLLHFPQVHRFFLPAGGGQPCLGFPARAGQSGGNGNSHGDGGNGDSHGDGAWVIDGHGAQDTVRAPPSSSSLILISAIRHGLTTLSISSTSRANWIDGYHATQGKAVHKAGSGLPRPAEARRTAMPPPPAQQRAAPKVASGRTLHSAAAPYLATSAGPLPFSMQPSTGTGGAPPCEHCARDCALQLAPPFGD